MKERKEEYHQTEEGIKELDVFDEQCIGRISEVQKNSYLIRYLEKEIPAKLSGKFYKEETMFPIVGDYVTFRYNPKGDSKIIEICERKNFLTRPDTAKSMKEQPMSANLDYAFLVMSLNDNFNLNRAVRYAATVLQEGIQPVAVLTKADLCNNVESLKMQFKQMLPQIKVHAVSALTGDGMDELNEYLQPGITIALLGSSGVGKSTLVNALAGTEIMKTGEIREKDAKGRHTTTYREMIELQNNVVIID
ncbi:MAG: GTPase RsgA, partial [Firmicutes bacterium]|nr:GTPase RsgA [Bacillota bacterium]